MNVMLTVFLLEGLALYVFDRGMKTNRANGVTEDMVRWAPLYWEKPHLFTRRGNLYRRAALATMLLLVLTALAMAAARPG